MVISLGVSAVISDPKSILTVLVMTAFLLGRQFSYFLADTNHVARAREEDDRRKRGILVDDPFWGDIVKTAKELNVDINGIMTDGYMKA